jgi:hypothetical protein
MTANFFRNRRYRGQVIARDSGDESDIEVAAPTPIVSRHPCLAKANGYGMALRGREISVRFKSGRRRRPANP